jgi:hypothetical protein
LTSARVTRCGVIFAHWVMFMFRLRFENYKNIVHFWATFSMEFHVTYFDKKWV